MRACNDEVTAEPLSAGYGSRSDPQHNACDAAQPAGPWHLGKGHSGEAAPHSATKDTGDRFGYNPAQAADYALRATPAAIREARYNPDPTRPFHQVIRMLSHVVIQDVEVRDIRFPTSHDLDGSDAMHRDPDYSAAYVTLLTNQPGLLGHGLTFTVGRGNEICVAMAKSLAYLIRGQSLESIAADMAGFWRSLTSESQLRWLGPEKGVIHLATAALVNSVWDLYAKAVDKPLWKLLVDLTPEEFAACIDFRYLTDVLTPEEALDILRTNQPTVGEREAHMYERGFPAYTTSAGWLGYSDEKIRQLCRAGLANGWNHFKIKVGNDIEDDCRRAAIIREEIGPQRYLMMDANQRWDVGQAIDHMRRLAAFDPWWIEEPTSPDDVLGHAAIAKAIAPVSVATGEMCQNRVMFKQFMQAGGLQICQIDSCRLGGVNEILAVLLMAKKFDIPVCPHAGGVGLCEYVNHLIMVDYIRIAASLENRIAEYVDHLHEHFVHPVVIRDAAYLPPTAAGYSITMKETSLDKFEFPQGPVWKKEREVAR